MNTPRKSTTKELLKSARAALAEGRLSEAHGLLDELAEYKERLSGLAPELASAESYAVPEDYRQLFQDRIELVNRHLRGDS
jgi:hypothetical protein